MPKNITHKSDINKERYKIIRKYVTFKYDLRKELTRYQKSKIKKYYDLILKLTARPYQLYNSKNSKRLKLVKNFAQQPDGFSELKYAFVPNNGPKVKIKVNKKGKVTTYNEHVTSEVIWLDKEQLLIDPEKHVSDLIKNTKFKRFTVQADVYEIPRSLDRYHVGKYVSSLMAKYGDEDANNYHGNWLNALIGHRFKNQGDFMTYMTDKQKAKERLQDERRKAKDRARKAKAKK